MRLIMLGPPGAGKGTQAKMLAERLNIVHISTGDMFRAVIAEGTSLGVQARSYIDRGELVPDHVTIDIVRERIALDDCRSGFLLDGFPRTVPQAEKLDEILNIMGFVLDKTVEVRVRPEEIVHRLEQRRSCPSCGRIYHLSYKPPVAEGVCDVCGTNLVHRSDDKREVIEKRIEVYNEKTGPLVEYYSTTGRLISVDGEKKIEEVLEEIISLLGA